MKIAAQLNDDGSPTGKIVILDGKHKGTVLVPKDNIKDYLAKNWLGVPKENVEWESDLGVKGGEVISGRDEEFLNKRSVSRLRLLIARATSDPVTKIFNGWADDITNGDY